MHTCYLVAKDKKELAFRQLFYVTEFGISYLLIRIALFITAGIVVTISIIRDKDTIDVLV